MFYRYFNFYKLLMVQAEIANTGYTEVIQQGRKLSLREGFSISQNDQFLPSHYFHNFVLKSWLR